MAKASGGTRIVKPTSGSKAFNKGIFENEITMSDIDSVYSYFSEKSGGYVLYMKGHSFERSEYEAMKHLANQGYVFVSTPEGGKYYISKVGRKKEKLYSDGLLMGFVSEIKTPVPNLITKSTQKSYESALENSIKKALAHASTKGANVAIIYDKNGIYNRNDIERGFKNYEGKFNHRFKAILVIDQYGKVWEHIHNE